MTAALILFPRLFLLFILGYFGRKLLSVAFFQLVPCGCELGFNRLALSDLLWQPGRIHFPLAIGSLGIAYKPLVPLFQLLKQPASALVTDPPVVSRVCFYPGSHDTAGPHPPKL